MRNILKDPPRGRKDIENEIFYIPYIYWKSSSIVVIAIVLGSIGFWLIFTDAKVNYSSVGSRHEAIADLMSSAPIIRYIAGGFLVSLSLFFLYGFIWALFIMIGRPYLIFSPEGLIITNLMMPESLPIPWQEISDYHIEDIKNLYKQKQIILHVDNFKQYARRKISSPLRPHINTFVNKANLEQTASYLDCYLSRYSNSSKNRGIK